MLSKSQKNQQKSTKRIDAEYRARMVRMSQGIGVTKKVPPLNRWGSEYGVAKIIGGTFFFFRRGKKGGDAEVFG